MIHSTKTILMIISVFSLLLLVIGCGEKVGSDGIYDTVNNPDNFPTDAVSIIERIESSQLNDFESISGAFGELYVTHADLLDNNKWQKIVNNLGVLFKNRADSLVGKGVEYYVQAGGLYTLASFARPEDSYAKRKAALFSVWQTGNEDTNLAVYNEFKGKDNLRFQIARVRQFVEGDSLETAFAQEYLIDQILKPLLTEKGDQLDQLDDNDRLFLKSLDLIP